MMLFPKAQKFQKQHKGRALNKVISCFNLQNLKKYTYSLMLVESGRIYLKQLKAIIQVIKKVIKKRGYLVVKVFPQTPITKKPIETRMGKGKGSVSTWIVKAYVGQIPFKIICKSKPLAIKALLQAKKRLHLNSLIIK